MRRFTLLTVVLASAVTFLIGVIVAGGLTPGAVVSSAPRRAPAIGEATKTGGPRAVTGAVNFADVAERINAAVVNIDATSKNITRAPPRRRAAIPGRELRRSRGRDRAAASSSIAKGSSSPTITSSTAPSGSR